MLLAQKREEVHLREDFGNLAQILGAEIQHNTAGRHVAHRGRLMDLIVADQHHAAGIDDISGVLDKIAARALDLIVDLVFVVDMEAGHFKAGSAVDALNKKVHAWGIGIFGSHTGTSSLRIFFVRFSLE